MYSVLTKDILESSDTRIVIQNSRQYASVTATSVVDFDYDFYFNDTTHFGLLDKACVSIKNVTIQQDLVPSCVDITTSGLQTFFVQRQLTEDYTYTWQPYLTSSSTSAGRIYGQSYYFSVVSEPVTQTLLPPTNATSTTALQGWFNSAQNAVLSVPPWSLS